MVLNAGESNKGSKKNKRPSLGVRLIEVYVKSVVCL